MIEKSPEIFPVIVFLYTIIFLSIPANLSLHAAQLIAGPMVGHTTSSSARIWVETDVPAKIQIDFWQESRIMYDNATPVPINRGSASGQTQPDFPHTCVVELSGLPEGWLTYYDIRINGQLERANSTQIFSLYPPEVPNPNEPDERAEFSIGFASCNFPARIPIQPIWAQVVHRRPLAFLFIGDNNYFPRNTATYEMPDENTRMLIAHGHRGLRNVGGIRELMASTPCYGIWDDHDYGPNDSDRTFSRKNISLNMFRRYWPNPETGISNTPGVFHSFRIADVEFFMLDDRYNRDPKDAADKSTMLGHIQLAWLKDRLKTSKATFKVIANGGTMVVDKGKETWDNFGSERDDFVHWLFQEKIDGVLFIAGDWHVGVLNRLHRPGDAYPLYELLSSNVAVKIVPRNPVEWSEGANNNQWVSPFFYDYNFGLLRFKGKREERTVTLQLIDESGNIPIDYTFSQHDLSVP